MNGIEMLQALGLMFGALFVLWLFPLLSKGFAIAISGWFR